MYEKSFILQLIILIPNIPKSTTHHPCARVAIQFSFQCRQSIDPSPGNGPGESKRFVHDQLGIHTRAQLHPENRLHWLICALWHCRIFRVIKMTTSPVSDIQSNARHCRKTSLYFQVWISKEFIIFQRSIWINIKIWVEIRVTYYTIIKFQNVKASIV